MGRQPSEPGGPRPATESSRPRPEDLDVGAGLRHGRVSRRGAAGDRVGRARGPVRCGQPRPGAHGAGFAGSPVLPGQPGGRRGRGEGAPPPQPQGAGTRVLGGSRVHLVDAASPAIRAPDVRHQPHDDMGRRLRNARDESSASATRRCKAIPSVNMGANEAFGLVHSDRCGLDGRGSRGCGGASGAVQLRGRTPRIRHARRDGGGARLGRRLRVRHRRPGPGARPGHPAAAGRAARYVDRRAPAVDGRWAPPRS